MRNKPYLSDTRFHASRDHSYKRYSATSYTHPCIQYHHYVCNNHSWNKIQIKKNLLMPSFSEKKYRFPKKQFHARVSQNYVHESTTRNSVSQSALPDEEIAEKPQPSWNRNFIFISFLFLASKQYGKRFKRVKGS